MGKREVGQLEVIDLIVSILIAELVAISIENYNESIIYTIIPILFLCGIQLLFSYISLKNPFFRSIIDGKPSVLIDHGKIKFKALKKNRYNLDELLISLREKNIKSIEDVEYAILENNGNLSIFKYGFFKFNHAFPMPLIIDGVINKYTLKEIKKSEKWLFDSLCRKKIKLNDVFYAFYKKGKFYIIKKQDF